MSKASEVITLVTQTLSNQGVLVETENEARITYVGSGNRKRASFLKPNYSPDQDVDVNSEANRLVEEAKAQIRAYQEPVTDNE